MKNRILEIELMEQRHKKYKPKIKARNYETFRHYFDELFNLALLIPLPFPTPFLKGSVNFKNHLSNKCFLQRWVAQNFQVGGRPEKQSNTTIKPLESQLQNYHLYPPLHSFLTQATRGLVLAFFIGKKIIKSRRNDGVLEFWMVFKANKQSKGPLLLLKREW